MIIALSSSPVVDTSAIAQALAARHGVEIVEDPMRSACRAYGFQAVYEMPEELQRQVRESTLAEHLRFLESGASGVLDFSAVSWVADWMRWFWNHTPTLEWCRVMDRLTACLGKYDLLYHVEGGSRRSYDGYAWLDSENAAQIERLIRHLYGELGAWERVRVVAADNPKGGPDGERE